MSKLSNDVKFFLQVAPISPFLRYFTTMQKCGLSRLVKKVIKWFDETKNLSIVLLGRTQGCFLHFMSLITALKCRANSGRERTILHVVFTFAFV